MFQQTKSLQGLPCDSFNLTTMKRHIKRTGQRRDSECLHLGCMTKYLLCGRGTPQGHLKSSSDNLKIRAIVCLKKTYLLPWLDWFVQQPFLSKKTKIMVSICCLIEICFKLLRIITRKPKKSYIFHPKVIKALFWGSLRSSVNLGSNILRLLI